MADAVRLDNTATLAVAKKPQAATQALEPVKAATTALDGNAKASHIDLRLAPGQAATIALEQPEGKGGPEQPKPGVDAKDLLPIVEQMVKLVNGLVGLIGKLFPGLGGAPDGKGGPAPATPPTQPAAPQPAAKTAPAAPKAQSVPPKRKGREPIAGEKMDALEAAFGPWKGIGKNTNPRKSTGPKGGALLESAYSKLANGDSSGAKKDYETAKKTGSPIMLDLDGDGKLGTTGVSTAKTRVDGQIGRTVDFDLDGDGRKEAIEWSDGKGDGFLVDDSDGGASRAAAGNGEIDGKRLFGDEGGKYANGYDKLKKFDRDADGVLEGAELSGLKMWVDNGDARVGGGELKSLADLGITRISVTMNTEKNARGEDLMRSTFEQNGATKVSEDVWFAKA